MIEQPKGSLAAGIGELWERLKLPSRFEQGFPDDYEETLFIESCCIERTGILEAIALANREIGSDKFLFVRKEHVDGGPNLDLVVDNESWRELWDLIGPLEYYLVGIDLQWLVWAFHEPCLHIAGSAEFVSAFKAAYPSWRDERSAYYESGGRE